MNNLLVSGLTLFKDQSRRGVPGDPEVYRRGGPDRLILCVRGVSRVYDRPDDAAPVLLPETPVTTLDKFSCPTRASSPLSVEGGRRA